MKVFGVVIVLLLPFFIGCDNFGDMSGYWVTIEKKRSFIIVDDDTKVRELIGEHYKGNDDKLPQIGWLIAYGGKPYGSGITFEAYACKSTITDNLVSGSFTKNKNEALVLMSKELLKQAKVLNEKDEVVDDLCLKSYLRNNHNIPEEKYMVKIDKEEIVRALQELN